MGHEDVPWVLRCLPPRTLITAARDGTIMVWDTDAGQCVRTIVAHSSAVLAMDVAHDDTASAAPAYQDDGVLVATGGADSLIKVAPCVGYERAGFFTSACRGFVSSTPCLGVPFDGSGAVVGGVGQVWRLATGECTLTLTGHAHGILTLAFTSWQEADLGGGGGGGGGAAGLERDPRGVLWLVSGSMDHTVRVWSPRDGTCKVHRPSHRVSGSLRRKGDVGSECDGATRSLHSFSSDTTTFRRSRRTLVAQTTARLFMR